MKRFRFDLIGRKIARLVETPDNGLVTMHTRVTDGSLLGFLLIPGSITGRSGLHKARSER